MKHRILNHSNIWLYFALVVFLTIISVFIIVTSIWFLLFDLNVIELDPHGRKMPLLLFFSGSILLGSTLAVFVGRVIIRPIKKLGDAFFEVSQGNFSIKVSENERIAEIREIAKQFNSMVHDLSHMETMRMDFVAGVSHEFKTPISSIKGYATLLQNNNLSAEKHDYYVTKILDNSKKLSALSSNMLLLSRLENQELVIGKKVFRLDEQIRQTILLLENKWTKKNIQFDLDLPCFMYKGSEELSERIWFNIIDNAIKHSYDGGNIEIRIGTVDGYVEVEISDSGEGMSDEILKHIFDKFYQGDKSRATDGNGLGLSLVKRIVDIFDGSIKVESTIGKGSSFHVFLPSE